jgi:GNAT superfamily N-acetyltransferase
VFLALSGDAIVGSLIVDGGEAPVATHGAHLRWFVVDDAHHGRGAGKALMAAAMDFIPGQFTRCYLTIFVGLDPARALYERAGFRLIEEKQRRPGAPR